MSARIPVSLVRAELRYCILLGRLRLAFSRPGDWDASYAQTRCLHDWPY